MAAGLIYNKTRPINTQQYGGKAGVQTAGVLADVSTRTACLVQRAVDGDVDAFGRLYRLHRSYVSTVVASRVRDPETRQDIEQETFARAWAKIGDLRDPSAFRPWISQIARRLSTDSYRAGIRTVHVDFGDPDAAMEPVDEDWGPDEWTSMRILASELDVAIANMSQRDATVLTMAANFGFGPAEIASALNIEAGHARVVLHRARRRLGQAVIGALDVEPDITTTSTNPATEGKGE